MLNQLQELIRQQTADDTIVITNDTVLLTDLGLNSYELIQLVHEIEEKFNVEVPDRTIRDFKTVQDILDYISENK